MTTRFFHAMNSTYAANASATITAAPNITAYKIPGIIASNCLGPPEHQSWCIAICGNNDTSCFQAASSYIEPCGSSWSAYNSIQAGALPTGPEWSYATTLEGAAPYTSTTTVNVYTTFSTANASFIEKAKVSNAGPFTTMTPVYALGAPSLSLSLITRTWEQVANTYLTAPVPTCKFNFVWPESRCGECTMTGGTVQLYFWPSATTTEPDVTQSTIVDGVTMISPSVYISFENVHARNQCSQIGQQHTNTIISMRAEDVSTQVHLGGKVFQSGANSYGRLNYGDLTGLPPASVYEMQPSCLMFGCETIYPSSSWDPTLVVPPQLRSIDPAWASCAVGLDGLYDPPKTLTAMPVEASVTMPSTVQPSPSTAMPSATANLENPIQTLAQSSSLKSSISDTASSHSYPLEPISPSRTAAHSAGDPNSEADPAFLSTDTTKTSADPKDTTATTAEARTDNTGPTNAGQDSMDAASILESALHPSPSQTESTSVTLNSPSTDLHSRSDAAQVSTTQVASSRSIAEVSLPETQASASTSNNLGDIIESVLIAAPKSSSVSPWSASSSTAFFAQDPATSSGTSADDNGPVTTADSRAHVSAWGGSDGVVDEQTSSRDGSIRLGASDSVVVIKLLTTSGDTYLAIDHVETTQPGAQPQDTVLSNSGDPSIFATISNDGLRAGGKTLLSDDHVTLGTGSMKTTLSFTSQSGRAAVVIDESRTEVFGGVASSQGTQSYWALPSISVVTSTSNSREPASTNVPSSDARHAASLGAARLIWVVLISCVVYAI